MNINFFAKKPFRHKSGHLTHASSVIRAEQVAAQIGAKLNPKGGYENGICIYVRPSIPPEYHLKFQGKPYLDVLDEWDQLLTLTMHPDVTAIACSQRDYETLTEFTSNEVILIPQHHCNFERQKRDRPEITTVGAIGYKPGLSYIPKELKDRLADRGMELLEYSNFYTRNDIVDFYKKIDIQIVWRPYRKKLANPLKIVNGASFGIPTVALYEPYFKEVEDFYLPVNNLDEFLAQVDSLKSSPSLYAEYSEKAFKKAEEYHIETVGKMYESLAV